MKITVFGATGQTGRHVLRELLSRGHAVTALARDPARVEQALREQYPDQLQVVQGDLLDNNAVTAALQGSEGFIFAAGAVRGSPPDLPARAAESVLAAAREVGVSRFVWLLGAAVMDPRDQSDAMRKIMRLLMKLVARSMLESSEQAYRRIVDSGLDYTVVRPPVLSNKPAQGALSGSYQPPKPSPISRADLAAFMVDALDDPKWHRESPMVCYA